MKTKKTKMRKFTEMLYWLSKGNAGSGILFSIHPANAESLKLGLDQRVRPMQLCAGNSILSGFD